MPGQLVPRQEVGGQARMALVRLPSDALLAVAPSSHCNAAWQTQQLAGIGQHKVKSHCRVLIVQDRNNNYAAGYFVTAHATGVLKRYLGWQWLIRQQAQCSDSIQRKSEVRHALQNAAMMACQLFHEHT